MLILCLPVSVLGLAVGLTHRLSTTPGTSEGQEWHWGWPHIQTRMGLLLQALHRWADKLC